ncbi:YciI-like protein [Bowmanella yangjiangensis]|uniref:YciI family protein n=1 Tax=Bowmanella yangjiangensis TaxID=2811230 RepID=A0ABS3CW03_9ALTE|nr:YciI-like protein [Bowmanella yangjiangensis]MBN7821299.1 YciI family protein [Bowmanella yangjiangensis]
MHYLLIYTVAEDYLARRPMYRDAHIQLAKAASARGELLAGGALSAPTDQAVLLFKAESAETVEDFARQDPYVRSGLVTSWQVRPWNIVIGAGLPSITFD